MLVIAHRGASAHAPENTLKALRLGWEAGADGAEIDVRLTRDGEVVVIHDATTSRTVGCRHHIAATDWPLLRKLNAGGGERIPLLSECLAELPEGKLLFIECKTGPEILPALRQAILESGKGSSLRVLSFHLTTVKAAMEALPGIAVFPVCDLLGGRVLQLCREKNLGGLVLNRLAVTEERIRRLRREKIDTYIFTVNHREEIRRLAGMGVAGVMTDDPELGRELSLPAV